MPLADSVILEEINKGGIIIEPFKKELLNPASLDIRLGDTLKVYVTETKIINSDEDLPHWASYGNVYRSSEGDILKLPLDPRKENKTVEIKMDERGHVLYPGEIYLYCALEKIGSKTNIGIDTKAKSSLGRLGLDIVIGPAGWIDPGFEGSLVLELRATRPIIVYPGMKIAQLVFHRLEGQVVEMYDKKEGSKYMNQEGVQASLYHKNFENEIPVINVNTISQDSLGNVTIDTNGLHCPECESLLKDVDNMTLLSLPPKRRVKCTRCEYTGYRIIS